MQRKSFTLAELATYTGSRLIGNPNHQIFDVADLETAEAEDASFLANLRYTRSMIDSHAGVIFVDPSISLIENRNFLIHETPSQAFQQTLEAFHGAIQQKSGFEGIHPSAVLHETCKIGQGVSIGPCAVIDCHVIIGDRTFIGAGCYIGPECIVGEDSILHPNVVLREQCKIGNRVIIQPGAVIGSCGFGYIADKQGKHIKLNQVGGVLIDDDVGIGANTTIDRARFKKTHISHGSKIDNLVQIGHGVKIGEHNIIIAQTGIAGSSTTGRHVIIAGQAGLGGHIKLADGVILAARSATSKSITVAGKYGGFPARPLTEFNRNSVHLYNIDASLKRLRDLEDRLAKLEALQGG